MQTIVKSKKLLPTTLQTIREVIGGDCELHNADGTEPVAEIAVHTSPVEGTGYMCIQFTETDDAIIKKHSGKASCVLSDHPVGGMPTLVVRDKHEAVKKIGSWLYGAVNLPAIIIMGSEGKTTTKRLTNSVLEQKYPTACLLENFNTIYAIPYAISKAETGKELFVQEADESIEDGPAIFSAVLKPEIVLITNIAEAHIALFGGKEKLVKNFLGITEGMPENGVVIINADDETSARAQFGRRVISVGINNKNADCTAENIVEKTGGAEFDLRYKGETTHIALSMHGDHNIYNAMMAFVVGVLKDIPRESIVKGLAAYQNSGMRQNIFKLGGNTIYLDCYNASLTSIRFALKCFDDLPKPKNKRIAILGDIAEIEGYEEETYRRIAEMIDGTSIDELYTCGKDSARIFQNLKRKIPGKAAKDTDELTEYLKRIRPKNGNSYLFKASRFMQLEKSYNKVFKLPLLAAKIKNKLFGSK